MQRIFGGALVILLATTTAFPRPRHSMVRLHAQANLRDTSAFASSVRAKLSGKDVAIERIPRISEQDIVAAKPYPHGNGDFGVLLQLDEHGRIALDTLSVERRGGYLFIFINGRAITEMQIDKRVSDGKIYVPSGLTAADIEQMKKDWPAEPKRRP